jgi:hypothetical protein
VIVSQFLLNGEELHMESIPEEMTDETRWGDGSDIKEYLLGISDTNNGYPCHSVLEEPLIFLVFI